MTNETQEPEVISDRLPDEPEPEPKHQPEEPAAADSEPDAEEPEESSTPEDEDADPDTGAEPPPKKNKGRYQKRITELTNARKELEREREYWREQALKGQAQDAPQSPEQPASVPQVKPSQDQYESYDAYLEALADWRYDQREQERERKARSQAEQEATAIRQRSRQQQLEDFRARVEAFAAETPDAVEVIYDSAVPINDVMLEIITAADGNPNAPPDIGPKLAYYLGRNRQEAQRIAQLSPTAAARELGRIEAKLSIPNPPKKTTSAPEPFAALGSSESVDDSDKPPSDPAAFAVWWKNRTRRKT